jgi:DNA-binding LacI/PurR family transcriptional regulator
VPKRALGEMAVATLDALLAAGMRPAPAKIALAGALVVRDSSGSPRRS